MPYISQEARYDIEENAEAPRGPGQLNYVITKIVHEYMVNHGGNYQAFNDILGALEGCKLELYRRKIAYYEDKKIKENGDV